MTIPTEYFLTNVGKPVYNRGKLLTFTPKYLAMHFGDSAKEGSMVKLQGKEYKVNVLDAFMSVLLIAD